MNSPEEVVEESLDVGRGVAAARVEGGRGGLTVLATGAGPGDDGATAVRAGAGGADKGKARAEGVGVDVEHGRAAVGRSW